MSKLSDLGDLQQADVLAAQAALIQAREKAAQQREKGSGGYRGAEYQMLTANLATLPASDDALYLMRLKSLQEPENPKPAKGSIPRAKQALAQRLSLPTRYYIHALKLVDGKFEDLHITKLVERLPA